MNSSNVKESEAYEQALNGFTLEEIRIITLKFREMEQMGVNFFPKERYNPYALKLEKALSKACERLEAFDNMDICNPGWSAAEWKEYLLNDKT